MLFFISLLVLTLPNDYLLISFHFLTRLWLSIGSDEAPLDLPKGGDLRSSTEDESSQIS
jgi:hypothetical protein